MTVIQGILNTLGTTGGTGNNPVVPRVGGDFSIEVSPDNETTSIPDSAINEEAFQKGLYTDYTIKNIYEKDGHIYAAGTTRPVSNGGATTALFKLCSSTLIWICDWTACRFTSQPNVPPAEPADSNWVLLDQFSELPTMTIGPDGFSPLWRRTGTYIYSHKNPDITDLDNLINFPRPPWIENTLDRSVSTTTNENNLSTSQKTANKPIQPNLTGFIS